jgi:hypothetical protein
MPAATLQCQDDGKAVHLVALAAPQGRQSRNTLAAPPWERHAPEKDNPMSFFDFFKLDSHAKETEKAKQEAQAALIKAADTLNIDVAVMAHENWKLRLETYLAGKSEEEIHNLSNKNMRNTFN